MDENIFVFKTDYAIHGVVNRNRRIGSWSDFRIYSYNEAFYVVGYNIFTYDKIILFLKNAKLLCT
jgi:hypothetical protein